MPGRAAIAPLLLACAVAGCSRASSSESAAFIADVARAHVEADGALERGDTDGARQVLTAAFERSAPDAMSPDDRRVIAQDLAYRLAEVEIAAGRAAEAVRWADRGLAQGDGSDVFTANLHIVRGKSHEAMGDDREAVDDYFRALEINDALLRRTLDGTEAP